MPKAMYKKLIANSENEVIKHSKFLKVSLRAIAKAIAKELKVSIKEIGPASHLRDQRVIRLAVESRKPIDQEAFKALTDTLHKYNTFCMITLDMDDGKRFSVAHYVDQPFGYKPA